MKLCTQTTGFQIISRPAVESLLGHDPLSVNLSLCKEIIINVVSCFHSKELGNFFCEIGIFCSLGAVGNKNLFFSSHLVSSHCNLAFDFQCVLFSNAVESDSFSFLIS